MERERKSKITFEQAKQIREEYKANTNYTFEYLADKYEVSKLTIDRIINNKRHHDPDYEHIQRKRGCGHKKSVYIPKHIRDMKDELVPVPQTAHRARGNNYVINKFA